MPHMAAYVGRASGPILEYGRVRRLRTCAWPRPLARRCSCIDSARVHAHAWFSLAEPRPSSRTRPLVPAGQRAPTDHERSRDLVEALTRLDELAKQLRRECPWDREQDERSIVPHTVEEAYELADAAHSGDDAKLLDEMGDVLYQVYFLSLILEERDAGDLAAVADNMREKLVRRHPHVFGERKAADAAEAIASWGQVKRERERGGAVFGDIPETLPGPLYAQKVLKRLAGAGVRDRSGTESLAE